MRGPVRRTGLASGISRGDGIHQRNARKKHGTGISGRAEEGAVVERWQSAGGRSARKGGQLDLGPRQKGKGLALKKSGTAQEGSSDRGI